ASPTARRRRGASGSAVCTSSWPGSRARRSPSRSWRPRCPGSAAAASLEAALHGFSAAAFDSEAAILAIAPIATEAESASGEDRRLVERLFEAFNRRDIEEISELCDEALDFFPVGTAEAIGRTAPYVGPDGLREYLRDVDQAWEELL